MKTKILLASAGCATVATILGISSVLIQGGVDQETFMSSIQTAMKLYQIAAMFGLLGISTFFVGLAYPAAGATAVVGKGSN